MSSPADLSKPATLLPRVLGPFDAIAVVVGSIIGSGIFLKVDTIAREMNAFGSILLVWLVGGAAALCGSLALAELAAMMPQAGGPYVYLREAYGRATAFLWGWAEFTIIRTGSLGSLACGTVIYFNAFLESLEKQERLPAALAEFAPLSHVAQAALTVSIIVVLCVVNLIGVRWSARTQNVTTIIKVSFLAFLIVGPWLFGKASLENLASKGPIDPENWWKAFGMALVAVFWPYDGWINITPVAEEVKRPERNVPLALVAGLVIVVVVYVGANVGYHSVLPMEEIQSTSTIAANVMEAIVGPWGGTLAAMGVTISMFGALNSNLMAGPRIYFAMARDRLFPAFMRKVHPRFKTPANAILCQGAWSLLQIGVVFAVVENPKEAFDNLTNFVVLGGVLFYALTVAAVFVLRRRQPSAQRPYRTLGYPLTPLVFIVAAAAVTVATLVEEPRQGAAIGLLLAAGGGVFAWFRGRERAEEEIDS